MPALLLDEKIVVIARALAQARVPHAFGGALALAYYATPRGTHDIDLNVFLATREAGRVLKLLSGLGVSAASDAERSALERDGQLRLHWGHTPLDLFFSYDPLHERCLERKRRVPFGEGAEIDVLAPEDLLIFKVIFDRPKDWQDIREMLFGLGSELDAADVLDWLDRILPADDPRLPRFRRILRDPLADSVGWSASAGSRKDPARS